MTAADLNDPDATYREVSSWVTGAKSASPILRTPTGKYGHTTCVDKVVDGVAPNQEPLPGLVVETEEGS